MLVGVDTHKRTHVLMAIDTEGRTHGRRTDTLAGWAAALQWEGDSNNMCGGASRTVGRLARASPRSCWRRARPTSAR